MQTSLFHERRQRNSVTVDAYAQDIKSLFHKAYLQAQQGGEAVESIGRSVLVSQFVAGLIPVLTTKVAGTKGKYEEILVKARFEGAKLRDLGKSAPNTVAQKPLEQSTPTNQPIAAQSQSSQTLKCSRCGVLTKYC